MKILVLDAREEDLVYNALADNIQALLLKQADLVVRGRKDMGDYYGRKATQIERLMRKKWRLDNQ